MHGDTSVPRTPPPADDDVLASEAATYAFCAKAWHLEQALRRPVAAQALERRAMGTALHQQHGVEIGNIHPIGKRLLYWSIFLLGLAAILLVLGLFAAR